MDDVRVFSCLPRSRENPRLRSYVRMLLACAKMSPTLNVERTTVLACDIVELLIRCRFTPSREGIHKHADRKAVKTWSAALQG